VISHGNLYPTPTYLIPRKPFKSNFISEKYKERLRTKNKLEKFIIFLFSISGGNSKAWPKRVEPIKLGIARVEVSMQCPW